MSGVRASGPRTPPLPDEWRQLEPLVDAVLDAEPGRRAALLAELSGRDAARREELERLVAECERPFPLLEQPVAQRFAGVFGDETPSLPDLLAGRYQILREVGRGGMAIVYVARDVKHGRDVAVKVIRPELAASLGRARFLREIEIAARLRHPHIVPVYDSGEVPAGESGLPLLYYVMPYETGHSLRERLAHDGPLPAEAAVLILRDVCEALAHAHQHGIVHSDIKPDNVLLAGGGPLHSAGSAGEARVAHATVTDFGVARAVSEATADASLAGGVAVGTPRYMAPEQAANSAHVDYRADIYAVGVLAYELLSGHTPFPDGTPQQLRSDRVADAVKHLASRRPDVPEALTALIVKCLAAQPADRWQSSDALLAQLASISTAIGSSAATAPSLRTSVVVSVALGAATLLALAVILTRASDSRPGLVLGEHTRLTAEPGLEVQPSISPDGRHVAYAEGSSLRTHIVVRPVAGGRATRLTTDTTESEWMPQWSPDGARIAFLWRAGVYSAPASAGPPRQEVAGRAGVIVTSATWSPDGREIAFVRGDSLFARTVAADRVRLISTGPDLHSCSWSPNGARLACVSGNSFFVTVRTIFGLGPMFGNLAPSRIVVIPAAGGAPVSVTDSGYLHQSPVWSRDSKTLYYVSNREGPRDVFALDMSARAPVRGKPVRVTTGLGAHSIDFSADGARIIYAAYTSSANIWSMPIPTGPPASFSAATPVTSGNQTIEGVRLSPDGQWLVYDSDLSGNSDMYRVPVTGGEPERLTRGPLDEFRGAIAPSGKELTYHSFQTGSRNMFLVPLDGGPVQQITHSSAQLSMANWSPDGTALTLFDMITSDVLVMRRDGRGGWSKPRFVGGHGWRPEWSPDGRTIAFVSASDGRIGLVPADSGAQRDLYVPQPGEPLAELAIYSANGRELYFKSHDGRGRASFWSIPLTGGRPRLLARCDDPARASNRFEFASDGKRFYFTVEDRQSDIWLAEVAAR